MADIPIIFSAPMVMALLAGQKTMTRRLAHAWLKYNDGAGRDRSFNRELYARATKGREGQRSFEPGPGEVAWRWTADPIHENGGRPLWIVYPKVQPGDRLWVREAFRTEQVVIDGLPYVQARFPEDHIRREFDPMRYKPSIHMPRWASRLTLVVTGVKIEPLTSISEEDAVEEGCVAGQLDDGFGPRDIGGGYTIQSSGTYTSAAGMFQILWCKLHGENAWMEAESTDERGGLDVVAVSFTVHNCNIDALPFPAVRP